MTHGYRRVGRNRDKPHRCPMCHTVRFRGELPRWSLTKVACEGCRVWWLMPLRW